MSSATIGVISGPNSASGRPALRTSATLRTAPRFQLGLDLRDQVGGHRVDHADDGLIAQHARVSGRRGLARRRGRIGEQPRSGQVFRREHLRLHAVVDVVRQIGDLVGEIDNLRLETRVQGRVELERGRAIFEFGMLDDSLAHLEAQIQTAKAGVSHLDPVDRPEALRVVIETAVRAHQLVQRVLAGMAERRMAEVVGKRDRFGKLLVEAQRARDGTRDLGRLQRMGEAGAIVVALVIHEDLGFVFEPAECRRMDYPIAIALESGAQRMLGLGDAPAAALAREHRIRRQHLRLDFLELLSRAQHVCQSGIAVAADAIT